MSTAAVTFVFNEDANLPIWVNYYGSQLGYENLFIIDRGSTDGSTSNLGKVNVIQIPRTPFDEDSKTHLMSQFHSALTACFDQVIMTDCDEILVPDPDYYRHLAHYLEGFCQEYVNAIGIDIIHVMTEDLPLDFSQLILTQRTLGRFHSPECKQLLSKTPTKWLPGLHSSIKTPNFDKRLFLFHTKLVDYDAAVKRQQTNLNTIWSDKSLAANYGAHHRYTLQQFVHQSFLVPLDIINRDKISAFEFETEIAHIEIETIFDENGFYRIPMNINKFIRIPSRFQNSF